MLYKTIIPAIVLLIIDRVLKFLAVEYNGLFVIGDQIKLGFELVRNSGIGLSIGLPVWISAPLAVIFLGYLGWLLYQQFARQKNINSIQILTLVLIIVGGFSNLTDRLIYSYVIDYFTISVIGRTFAFNLADVLVVGGVVVLLFDRCCVLFDRCWVRTSCPHPKGEQCIKMMRTGNQHLTTTARILALNKKTYNKIAAQFSQTREKPLWPEIRQFKQYIKNNDKILDIGCGNGRLLQLFDDMSVDYTGIENSAKLLEQAKTWNMEHGTWNKNQKAMVKFLKMDMLKLDFGDNLFDAVFMIASLHHLPAVYHHQALSEAYRVLKHGRHLLMTNFNLWRFSLKDKTVWQYIRRDMPWRVSTIKNVITLWNNNPLYYYTFTLRELKRKCKKAGFKIIKAYYTSNSKTARIWNGNNLVLILEK